MKSIQIIRKHIQEIPEGRPFTVASLMKLASYANIRQVLSRLVKSGEITRVARGIFVRPKEIPYVGKSLPEPKEIAEVIAQTSGETIGLNGAEAARLLQLSTQMSMKPVFYTTGNTRRIKVGNLYIVLKHVSPRKLVKPNTIVGLVISALWYLGKENVTYHEVEKIKQQLNMEQFAEVIENIHNMPAWMARAFHHYQQRKHHV